MDVSFLTRFGIKTTHKLGQECQRSKASNQKQQKIRGLFPSRTQAIKAEEKVLAYLQENPTKNIPHIRIKKELNFCCVLHNL